ncbi:4Fe-4S dicluster domain-containing protein [Candidatus Izimaplasma bacterium]|nr:4Fe-4S dicluster domain-containing protein [Candidatus Izimaplasma bacterium]
MITENKTFLEPKKVYLPLTDNLSKIANVKVVEGEKVITGQVIAEKFNGKVKTPVIATISGEVIGFTEKIDRHGKLVDHVIIENDFKTSTVELKPYPNEISPAEIRNRLSILGVKEVSYDGLYTEIDFTNPVEHVIVNAVFNNEPFVSTEYGFVMKHAEEIADGIVLLGKAAYAKTVTIIVDKFMDVEAYEELGKAISDKEIELKLINTKKIKGWDYKVAQKLVKEPLSNNLLDNGILYTTIDAAKMVHDAIREGMPLTRRQVALTGDSLKSNAIYDVRIGTLFIDLVEDLEGYNESENMNLHIGNYLTGIQLPTDDFAITGSVDSVEVSDFEEEDEDVCIKCGDCNDVCPAGILPQNIMDAELRNVNQRIVDLNTNECVECGLCTFVCPSKINVLEWVRRAKRRVG